MNDPAGSKAMKSKAFHRDSISMQSVSLNKLPFSQWRKKGEEMRYGKPLLCEKLINARAMINQLGCEF